MYIIDRVPKRLILPALLLGAIPLIVWVFCKLNPQLPKIAASEILDRTDDLVWIARGRPGLDDKVIAANKVPLAEYYARIGQFEQSRLLYRQAIRDCQAMNPGPSGYTATLMRGMARDYMALGNDWQAEQLLKDAIAIHSEPGDFIGYEKTDYEETAADMCTLGTLYRKQAKYKEAAEMYRKALETAATLQGATLVEPVILYELATLKVSESDFDEAQRYYKMTQSETANDPSVLMALIELAHAYILKGRFGDAEDVVRYALTKSTVQDLSGQYCLVGPGLNSCADLLDKAGRSKEAALFRSYAKEVEGDWEKAPDKIEIW
jgi:tetratricopeptide (TPR) repeat protein